MSNKVIQSSWGSSGISQVAIRMPVDVHARMKERAAKNGRSMNSELVASLIAVLDGDIDENEMMQMVRQIHAVTVAPYAEPVVVSCEDGQVAPVRDWLLVNADQPE